MLQPVLHPLSSCKVQLQASQRRWLPPYLVGPVRRSDVATVSMTCSISAEKHISSWQICHTLTCKHRLSCFKA